MQFTFQFREDLNKYKFKTLTYYSLEINTCSYVYILNVNKTVMTYFLDRRCKNRHAQFKLKTIK